MAKRIETYKDMRVYRNAMRTAMELFRLTKSFPPEEKYSMVDQIRRSSRSVCTNIAEAWRKRRYKPAFVAKLNDAESEASESQTWIEFAHRCSYVGAATRDKLDAAYDEILAQLVRIINDADKWLIKAP